MADVASRARVVITTVGPYVEHGGPLVAACAEAGTDYVDLTGEPEFVDRTYVEHHARAVETGARIVHACGFDSVPHDLGAMFTVQQLPSRGPAAGPRHGAQQRDAVRRHPRLRPRGVLPVPADEAGARRAAQGRAAPRGPPGPHHREAPAPRPGRRLLARAAADDRPLRRTTLGGRPGLATARTSPTATTPRSSGSPPCVGGIGLVGGGRGRGAGAAAAPAADEPAAAGRGAQRGAPRGVVLLGAVHRRGRRPPDVHRGPRRRPGLHRDRQDARRSRRSAWPSTTTRRPPARSPPPSRWGRTSSTGWSARA